nr:hypothetical protein [Tanacetum cinerariifolium]
SSLVYEQEPSYNHNYNGNYYPHDLPRFPCCDNYGESHEAFQCQPMDQNIDFFGSDQIQTPQYPDVHPPSQEISDEVFHAKGDLMKSIQTFLEEFNYIPFEEKPKILLQAWDSFLHFSMLNPRPLEDLHIINKELIECNRPIFFDNNEEHSVQHKEYSENSSNEIASSNSNQEKEKPPQDFDIRQLIREEWCIEVCEEQRQNMENTMLELVKICQEKELYCMHDNVDDIIESALNFKLLSTISQRLNKEKQEVKNVIDYLEEFSGELAHINPEITEADFDFEKEIRLIDNLLAGMPNICTTCGGIVRGGLCLPCDLREKNVYNYDPNAYSVDNSNYFPQSQDENYLCNLCGNNSHDDYDCQQQFPFVYEQEPSYNQNYDDNYYPHESLSFPCCDYCGGSHETFQCQPDNQNIEFSGSDQIQTLEYSDVNPPSPEISNEEIFQAKGDLMKSIQTFLE